MLISSKFNIAESVVQCFRYAYQGTKISCYDNKMVFVGASAVVTSGVKIPCFVEFLHRNNRLQSRVVVSFNDEQILFITSNRNMMTVIPVFDLHNKFPSLLNIVNSNRKTSANYHHNLTEPTFQTSTDCNANYQYSTAFTSVNLLSQLIPNCL